MLEWGSSKNDRSVLPLLLSLRITIAITKMVIPNDSKALQFGNNICYPVCMMFISRKASRKRFGRLVSSSKEAPPSEVL